jgi:kynurenine 3-monooxygenase
MVSFTRTPYAVALERGRWQRELLVEATRGIDDITQVDLGAVDASITQGLEPLPEDWLELAR